MITLLLQRPRALPTLRPALCVALSLNLLATTRLPASEQSGRPDGAAPGSSCVELYEARCYRSGAGCFLELAEASDPTTAAVARLGAVHSLVREAEIYLMAAELAAVIQEEYYPILARRLPDARVRGYASFFTGWLLYLKGSFLEAQAAFQRATADLPDSDLYKRIARIGVSWCSGRPDSPETDPEESRTEAGAEPLLAAWKTAFASFPPKSWMDLKPSSQPPFRVEGPRFEPPILAHTMGSHPLLIDSLLADAVWTGKPTLSVFVPVSDELGRDIGYFDPSMLILARAVLLEQARAQLGLFLEAAPPSILPEAGEMEEEITYAMNLGWPRLHRRQVGGDSLANPGTVDSGDGASSGAELKQPDSLQSPIGSFLTRCAWLAESGASSPSLEARVDSILLASESEISRSLSACEHAGRFLYARSRFADAEAWLRRARLLAARFQSVPDPALVLRHDLALLAKDRDAYGAVLGDLRKLEIAYPCLRQAAEPMEIVAGELIRTEGILPSAH